MAIAAVIADMSEQPMPKYVRRNPVGALKVKAIGDVDIHGNRMVTFSDPGYGAREFPAVLINFVTAGDFLLELSEPGSYYFMRASAFNEQFVPAT